MKYIEQHPDDQYLDKILEFAVQYPKSMQMFYFRSGNGNQRRSLYSKILSMAAEKGVKVHLNFEAVATTNGPVLRMKTNFDFPTPKD